MERITAKENMYLTQLGDVATTERVYCTELICPDGESGRWRDADEEEYLEWQAEYERVTAEQEEQEYGLEE